MIDHQAKATLMEVEATLILPKKNSTIHLLLQESLMDMEVEYKIFQKVEESEVSLKGCPNHTHQANKSKEDPLTQIITEKFIQD